jgi:hypothetical protein
MNTEERKLKGLSGTRFEELIFLFRMAGIPLQMKKVSPIYAVYMITTIVCTCSTFLGMFFHAYMHRDNLGITMKTIHMLIGFTNIVWLFSYCR